MRRGRLNMGYSLSVSHRSLLIGDDEPKILSYEKTSNCSIGADVGQVEETPTGEASEARDKSRSAVANSPVYILGFNFDRTNVQTIGLDQKIAKDTIYVLNFDGHERVRRRLEKLGVPSDNITAGTHENRLHIHEAIQQGFFE